MSFKLFPYIQEYVDKHKKDIDENAYKRALLTTKTGDANKVLDGFIKANNVDTAFSFIITSAIMSLVVESYKTNDFSKLPISIYERESDMIKKMKEIRLDKKLKNIPNIEIKFFEITQLLLEEANSALIFDSGTSELQEQIRNKISQELNSDFVESPEYYKNAFKNLIKIVEQGVDLINKGENNAA